SQQKLIGSDLPSPDSVSSRVVIQTLNESDYWWIGPKPLEIFVDGLLVDLMWDVHDWLFNLLSGSAVFIFRTRSSGIFDNRLWLEENHKMMMPQTHMEEHQRVDFSLLIYA
ncbi:hypothetical protein Dimus_035478, partial [Dionaea muscipula]